MIFEAKDLATFAYAQDNFLLMKKLGIPANFSLTHMNLFQCLLNRIHTSILHLKSF